jgi:hypothetical protein
MPQHSIRCQQHQLQPWLWQVGESVTCSMMFNLQAADSAAGSHNTLKPTPILTSLEVPRSLAGLRCCCMVRPSWLKPAIEVTDAGSQSLHESGYATHSLALLQPCTALIGGARAAISVPRGACSAAEATRTRLRHSLLMQLVELLPCLIQTDQV